MNLLDTDLPRIRILTTLVRVTVHGKTVRHYSTLLGMPCKEGTPIVVPPSMLPANSNCGLLCECPMCGKQRIVKPCDITRLGHTLCQGCRQRESAYKDLIGSTVGRLKITGFAEPTDSKTGGRRTKLTAVCACGNTTTVWGQALRDMIRVGGVASCGCYGAELIRAQGYANAGSANGMWRSDLSLEERHMRNALRKNLIRTWSKRVRRRDGGKCVICGSTEGVEAHHLSGVNTSVELSLSTENGVTLCRFHHEDFHCRFMGHVHAPVTTADFERYCAAPIEQSQPE